MAQSSNKQRKPRSNAAAFKKQAMEEKKLMSVLNADMKRAFNEGMNTGYGTAMLVMFWLLHTEHGFGKKRLVLLMRKINDFCINYIGPSVDGQQYDPKNKDRFEGVSLNDIAEALAAECGIHIDTKTWLMEFDGVEVIARKSEEK